MIISNPRTDICDNPSAYSRSTGRQIRLTDGAEGRWTYVYVPTAEAIEWDIPGNAEGVNATLGNQYGSYSYARIKVVGRTDRYDVAGLRHTCARKLAITICIGTEDEETISGWLIDGGDDFTTARVW